MKVIVSHDVDHLTFREHRRDLVIPKFIIRYLLEAASGKISITELSGRIRRLASDKWHNLEELMAFNKENHVPSTFFIGVSNGKGLMYTAENAEFWVRRIAQEGFDVGVHGIAYDSYDDIKHEYDTFKRISGLSRFGIRMHYLRKSGKTLQYLSMAGYLFDSTIYEIDHPYKVNALWEFPLFIMDVDLIRNRSVLENQNFEQIKDATMKTIDGVYKNDINYLTVNLHDRFFHDSFSVWKKWYTWLIQYINESKIEFINYKDAIEELESASCKDEIHQHHDK